jgi:hypothetical protein
LAKLVDDWIGGVARKREAVLHVTDALCTRLSRGRTISFPFIAHKTADPKPEDNYSVLTCLGTFPGLV